MDKLEQVKKEIERRRDIFRTSVASIDGCKANVLTDILSFIDSLQEETVSEDLEEACKEWLRPQLDKTYVNYGEAKMMELTRFDGYAMLDAIEFGAQWQKEKMLENAVDGIITFDYYSNDDKEYGCIAHDSFCLEDMDLKDRDKVKIAVIK